MKKLSSHFHNRLIKCITHMYITYTSFIPSATDFFSDLCVQYADMYDVDMCHVAACYEKSAGQGQITLSTSSMVGARYDFVPTVTTLGSGLAGVGFDQGQVNA